MFFFFFLPLLQRQVKEGIDAVIVDNVLAIRRGLTKDKDKGIKDEEDNTVDGEETAKSTATVTATA